LQPSEGRQGARSKGGRCGENRSRIAPLPEDDALTEGKTSVGVLCNDYRFSVPFSGFHGKSPGDQLNLLFLSRRYIRNDICLRIHDVWIVLASYTLDDDSSAIMTPNGVVRARLNELVNLPGQPIGASAKSAGGDNENG
jgi:hypothetical protein